jgi:restriction system protein
MPIPDFQSFILPLLKLLADRQEHKLPDAAEILAAQFKLDEADKTEMLPSGKKLRYYDRAAWAGTYLRKAGLAGSSGRGTIFITEKGIEVLRTSPARIDINFLMQFPDFVEFKKRSRTTNGEQEQPEVDVILESRQTPRETLELSYQSLRSQLASDLLDKVKTTSPRFFEKLVVDLLVQMGYGGSQKDAGKAVGQSGDGGIDGIIKEDKLGLDVVYLQAKRWDAVVGRPVVQAFAGALDGQRAKKGVLITTSQFSREAQEYVKIIEKKIVLIDGEELAQLMIEHGVGVSEKQTYIVKEIDIGYFSEEE